MYCPNNHFRCQEQGYCNCNTDGMAEAVDCNVEGKKSPLTKVYFKTKKSPTKIIFVYNVFETDDILKKVN